MQCYTGCVRVCVREGEQQHEGEGELTLTCSLALTAQNTISTKFCEGNMRKHTPPITQSSFTSNRLWCFLHRDTPTRSPWQHYHDNSTSYTYMYIHFPRSTAHTQTQLLLLWQHHGKSIQTVLLWQYPLNNVAYTRGTHNVQLYWNLQTPDITVRTWLTAPPAPPLCIHPLPPHPCPAPSQPSPLTDKTPVE